MKKNTILFFLFFILIAQFSPAQTFPMLIKKGETKTFKSDSESVIILLGSQMKGYLDSLNELKFARKKISLLAAGDSLHLQQEQIYIHDTVVYANLYHHYFSLWDSTDHKLETTEIKLVKANNSKWKLGLVGIVIGVVATLLIIK